MQANTIGGDAVLGEFMSKATARIFPDPNQAPFAPIKDKIGFLILLRVIYHLSDPDNHPRDKSLIGMIMLLCLTIGTQTGLKQPENSYMELLQQLN